MKRRTPKPARQPDEEQVAAQVLHDFRATAPGLAWLRNLAHLRLARVAHAMVVLGIADALEARPLGVATLARRTGTHAATLGHFLRALCATGLAQESARGRFSATEAGGWLRRAGEPSVALALQAFFEPELVPMDGLVQTVRSGRPAFEVTHGMPFYDHLERHALDGGARFDARMNVGAGLRARALLELVDWRSVGLVADIGGGEGLLLAHLLSRHAAMRGLLVERPRTARRARRRLAEVGLGRRCRVVAGDFFADVPTGAQAYLLSFVLHNWDDVRCAELLARCRQAMADDAVLHIVEQVREPGPDGSVLAYFDLPALELLGGQERSATEFRRLARHAGLRLTSIARQPGNPFAVLTVRRR